MGETVQIKDKDLSLNTQRQALKIKFSDDETSKGARRCILLSTRMISSLCVLNTSICTGFCFSDEMEKIINVFT